MPWRIKSLSWWSALCAAVCLLFVGPAGAQPFEHYREARAALRQPDLLVEKLGQAAYEPLLSMLAESKNAYRVVEAIAATRHPKAKAFLLAKLVDPGTLDTTQQRRIREEAIEALSLYSDDPQVARGIAALLLDEKAGRFPQEKAAAALVAIAHPAAAGTLLQAAAKIHWGNYPLLNLLARALGANPAPEVRAFLKRKLTEKNNAFMPWFDEIATGLARRKDTALVPELVAAAEYGLGNRTVVPAVYQALGELGDTRAVDVLRQAVLKKDFRIRYWSAVSLGLLGDKRALPELQQAFGQVKDYAASQLHVNQAAISYARARLGDPEGERYLQELIKNPEPEPRMIGLMFLMKAHAENREGLEYANRIVAEIRPYREIDGCPRHDMEQIFDNLARIGAPERVALLDEVAGWQKADRAPWAARKALERLSPAQRAERVVARIRAGSWEARNRAARELECQVPDPVGIYQRLLVDGDVPARVIALRRLGLIFPDRAGKELLQAGRDPAWQVSDEAARLSALRAGQDPYPAQMPEPERFPEGELIGYSPAQATPTANLQDRSPLAQRPVRRLLERPDGTIWAATRDGLQVYDGMQWHRLGKAQGLCSDQVFDLALQGGQVLVACDQGLSIGDGIRFDCLPSPNPLLRLAASGRAVFAGTTDGVVELRGKKLHRLSGPQAPAGRIGALIAEPDSSLWVALEPPEREPDGDSVLAPLYRLKQGSWTALAEPFFHYNGRLSSGIGHARGPVAVRDLALDPKGGLLLATSYGVFRHADGRFINLSRGKGYWPWHPAISVASAAEGRVLAGFPGYLDVLQAGRWKRLAYQDLAQSAHYVSLHQATVTCLTSANGELWLASQNPVSLGKQYGATVLRLPVRDPKRIGLPPDTLVAVISGGAFRAENPDTDLRPPNRLRAFDGGKPVRVPANIVAISAQAKDPWDYGPVQFRFKVDESAWTDWSEHNGLLSPQILDEGVHRVQVQSKDAHGNVDPSPAEVRFSVYTKEMTVIKIHDGQFERIFPSQYMRYQKVGLGRVRLENTQNKPVEVNLELKIEDLFERPAATTVTLAANESRWVEVAAPFSDKVLSNEGQRTVQAVVEARYGWEAVERSTRRSFALELLEANAFVWDEPARLATFINGRDPLVQKLAADLYRAFAAEHPQQAKGAHPLRNYLLALYTYAALSELGIQYKPDPERPFASVKAGSLDAVQYPSQTLLRKTGDCDDLTVLFASLLENLNVPTAVLPVEGHVFMMFDSGVRAENRAAFPVDARKTVEREGVLWVPIEATVLGKSKDFETAWSRGAENFHGKYHPSAKQVVLVRAAWAEFPPATRPVGAEGGLPTPRLAGAGQETGALLQGYGKRIEQLAGADAGSPTDAAALLKRGALLAKSGLFDQAATAYQQAATAADSFAARYGLGAAQAGRGEVLSALVEFQKALGLAAGNQERFCGLLAIAQCYKVNGNLAKARANLDEALKLNPAARFDKRYSPLVKYLTSQDETKAAAEDETPPFFQEILSGL